MPFPIALAGVLGSLLGPVLEKMIPDTNARAKAQAEIATAIASMDLTELQGQLQANVEAAKNSSVFISGARPFALWGSTIGLLYCILVWPHLVWLATLLKWPQPPSLDVDTLYVLVTGLLGLVGARTVERVKGVARTK